MLKRDGLQEKGCARVRTAAKLWVAAGQDPYKIWALSKGVAYERQKGRNPLGRGNLKRKRKLRLNAPRRLASVEKNKPGKKKDECVVRRAKRSILTNLHCRLCVGD